MIDYTGLYEFSPELIRLAEEAEKQCREVFRRIDGIAEYNEAKVLKAFTDHRVSAAHLVGTTGYGYDDMGRDTLDAVFAQALGAEDAIVRHNFVSGTHTLTVALFGVLRAGDTVVSVTGAPYDTMEEVIGIRGGGTGSLKEYGIQYRQVELLPSGEPDYPAIEEAAKGTKMVYIQRSRGYSLRPSLTVETIGKIAQAAKKGNPDAVVFVDNCYGEFVEKSEPVSVGADLMAGSLIKNPGGGIAPTGGYIAGRKDLVELCAYRLNAPGLGKELGCTLETPRDMYLGFYYAPGVVCEAIKTAIYAQCMLELLGKNPVPRYCDDHNDIVTCFDAGTADALIGFCQGIQAASPVDSYAAPEPSPEPGYTDEVVMASGSFTQGSTIELSCDGPLREPYTCYLQGGLNFAASRAGVLLAIQKAYFKD